MALDTPRGPTPASRKIRRLGIAVAIVVALYSAGWFYVASKFEDYLSGFMASNGPVDIKCPGLRTEGFPFLMGFTCSKTEVADAATGNALVAGPVRAAAVIYNPGSAVVELDGPANASLSDGTAIEANWSKMRSSFSVGLSSLKTFSATSEDVSLNLMSANLYDAIVAKAKHGEIHFRGNGANLETALLARDFELGAEGGPSILPTLSTSAEVTLDGKADLLEGKPLVSKAMKGTLTSFKIETPEGLYGEMTGPFEIDEQGYISGTFKTRFEKLDLWEQNLLKLFPKADNTISGMAALLKGLAKGGQDVTVNLVVDRGAITLSMLPLGHIPPI